MKNSSYMLQEPDDTVPIWCHECGSTSQGSYNRNWQQCAMCRNYMCEEHKDFDAGTRPPLCWLCKERCGDGDVDLDLRYCRSCKQVAYFRKDKCLNRKCEKYICRPGAEGGFDPYQRGEKWKNRSWTGEEMAGHDRQDWGPKRKRNKGRKRVQWWADRMEAKGRQKGQPASARPRGSRDAAPFEDEDQMGFLAPDEDEDHFAGDETENEDEVVESSADEVVQPDDTEMDVVEAAPETPNNPGVPLWEATTFAYVVTSFASWTHSIHTYICWDMMCSVYACCRKGFAYMYLFLYLDYKLAGCSLDDCGG
jgi:hypothetical protein